MRVVAHETYHVGSLTVNSRQYHPDSRRRAVIITCDISIYRFKSAHFRSKSHTKGHISLTNDQLVNHLVSLSGRMRLKSGWIWVFPWRPLTGSLYKSPDVRGSGAWVPWNRTGRPDCVGDSRL